MRDRAAPHAARVCRNGAARPRARQAAAGAGAQRSGRQGPDPGRADLSHNVLLGPSKRSAQMCAPVVVSSKPTGIRTAAIWRKPGVQGGRGELPGWVENRPSPATRPMTASRRFQPFAGRLSNRSIRPTAAIRRSQTADPERRLSCLFMDPRPGRGAEKAFHPISGRCQIIDHPGQRNCGPQVKQKFPGF